MIMIPYKWQPVRAEVAHLPPLEAPACAVGIRGGLIVKSKPLHAGPRINITSWGLIDLPYEA